MLLTRSTLFTKHVSINASQSEPFRIHYAFPIKEQSNEACHSCEMHCNTKQKAPTYILTTVLITQPTYYAPAAMECFNYKYCNLIGTYKFLPLAQECCSFSPDTKEVVIKVSRTYSDCPLLLNQQIMLLLFFVYKYFSVFF